MGQIKSQLSWLLRGSSRTNTALSSYADDLRALQLKVALIDEALQSLQSASNDRAGQLGAQLKQMDAEVAHLKAHLRTAVDDLGDRLGSISERTMS